MRGRRFTLAVAIVVVPLLVYPLLTLTDGLPRFPTRDECARAAQADDEQVEVVYGRFEDLSAADELLTRVVALGFVGTELRLDGCGRWKVHYDSIESYDQAQALAEQARRVGLDPRVEPEG